MHFVTSRLQGRPQAVTEEAVKVQEGRRARVRMQEQGLKGEVVFLSQSHQVSEHLSILKYF